MRIFRNWYWIAWVIGAVIAVLLYMQHTRPDTFVGVVEKKNHQISSQVDGVLTELYVQTGDRVQIGQVLAQVDFKDIRAEYDKLQILGDIMRIEGDFRNEAAELAAEEAEIRALNAEIRRLQSAQSAGVLPAMDLAELIIRRDALKAHADAWRRLLEVQARQRPSVDQPGSMSDAQLEFLRRGMMDIEGVNRDLGRIVSPCDGLVTDVGFQVNDTINAFLPFMEIEETIPTHLKAYVPEKREVLLKHGDRVLIVPHRPGADKTGGTVAFIYPGYSQLPDRFLLNNQVQPWVRKIYIELDQGHNLLPGERVEVRITPGADKDVAQPPEAAKSPDQTAIVVKPQRMDVPEELIQRSRLEPSGLLWLQDLDRFLVVSDDTGLPNDNSHAPWLFLMDAGGRVDPEPVVLKGIDRISDLEAVTAADEDSLYLLSSQNLNKQGERTNSRQYLLKVQRQGPQFAVAARVDVFSALVGSYDREALDGLGLTQADDSGELVLNIEGMAWLDGSMFLGLKEPISERGAIIWKLTDPERLFESGKLEPGQLTLFAEADLGGYKGRQASISDMAFFEDTGIVITSTIPGATGDRQMGGCYLVRDLREGVVRAERIYSFPGLTPEGASRAKPGELTIVFDTGDQPPLFITVAAAK